MENGIDVACFGEILWDFYEAVPKEKEAISRTFKREIGGATANVAVTLARLGLKASVVGGIGDEKLGQALETQLVEEGVETGHLIKVKAPTGRGFLLPNGWTISPAGDQVGLTDLPLNILPLADGRHALVGTAGYNAHQLSLVDLAEHCRALGLARQKVPEQLEIVDDVPRNAMGKIQKPALKKQFSA